jgi:hypothetical protein
MHEQLKRYEEIILVSQAQFADRSTMPPQDQILADLFANKDRLDDTLLRLQEIPDETPLVVLESRLDQVNAGIYTARIYTALIDHLVDAANRAFGSDTITSAFALRIPLYEYDRTQRSIRVSSTTIFVFEFSDPKYAVLFRLKYGTELNEFPTGFRA